MRVEFYRCERGDDQRRPPPGIHDRDPSSSYYLRLSQTTVEHKHDRGEIGKIFKFIIKFILWDVSLLN